MARSRRRAEAGLALKRVGLGPKQRKVKAQLLKALQQRLLREYKRRLRRQDVVDGQLPFPRVRVLRRQTSEAQRQVLHDILMGKIKTVRAKESVVPKDWFQATLLIEVLGVAPVNVLYLQNMDLDDYQLNRMIDVLKSNKHIIAVNLGEVGDVSAQTWQRLLRAIPDTNVSFMYISEHQAGPQVTAEIKANKDKNTSSKADWRSADFHEDIAKMWWNPTRSKHKQSFQ